MIYFIGDTHFGHTNIISLCKRPFKDADHMDKVIIDNINAIVEPDDVLWHLGDFCYKGKNSVDDYRKRINCREIHLILGNHDRESRIEKWTFESVGHYQRLDIARQTIVLSHYPFAVWEKKHYNSYQLHGHNHGRYIPGLPGHFENGLQLDVGVDVWDFKPISLDEIRKQMKKKLANQANKSLNIFEQ